MLGIVLATHGTLSDGLKDAANVIMGSVNNMVTVNLKQEDDVQMFGEKITKAIYQVDQKEGVLVLVDVVSASPYNQSLLAVSQLAKGVKEETYVIGGTNLPMLLEAINHQLLHTPIATAAKAVMEQGKDSIDLWHALSQKVAVEEDEDDF
ncbi:PTS fructose transporter subunit IIA [Enterococcus hirae]|uniref:PTS sugar transporter subunit IIA n=1 Tax=Candidatus Enterococcus wittei TaxID=1987383 RepID=UPI000A33C80E|nr:PTS fructose transporter subunit IIA [Enterococcus sp. 10A9_DIV0425]THE12952.1 PTS fructose transporter subunit IIA [Enterococcus hirae]